MVQVEAWLHAPEEVWGDGDGAPGGEFVAGDPHVGVDAEDLLQRHDDGRQSGGGPADVGAELPVRRLHVRCSVMACRSRFSAAWPVEKSETAGACLRYPPAQEANLKSRRGVWGGRHVPPSASLMLLMEGWSG